MYRNDYFTQGVQYTFPSPVGWTDGTTTIAVDSLFADPVRPALEEWTAATTASVHDDAAAVRAAYAAIRYSLVITPIYQDKETGCDLALFSSDQTNTSNKLLCMPGSLSVDAATGEILLYTSNAGNYTAEVQATDSGGQVATVYSWVFMVHKCRFHTTAAWKAASSSAMVDGGWIDTFYIGNARSASARESTSVLIEPPWPREQLFEYPATGDFDAIKFFVEFDCPATGKLACLNTNVAHEVMTNPTSGRTVIIPNATGTFNATLYGADVRGTKRAVYFWNFAVYEAEVLRFHPAYADLVADSSSMTYADQYALAELGAIVEPYWETKAFESTLDEESGHVMSRSFPGIDVEACELGLFENIEGEVSYWVHIRNRSSVLAAGVLNGRNLTTQELAESTDSSLRLSTPGQLMVDTLSGGAFTLQMLTVGDYDCRLVATDASGLLLTIAHWHWRVVPASPPGLTIADIAAISVGVVLFVMILVTVAYFVNKKMHENQPHNFSKDVDRILAAGVLSSGDRKLVPHELPRTNITVGERIGGGNFGDVFTGEYKEIIIGGSLTRGSSVKSKLDAKSQAISQMQASSRSASVRAICYPVAVKQIKAGLEERVQLQAEIELIQEAAVMAVIGRHPNICSLIGVVTKGDPLLMVVSLCTNGSLLSVLRKQSARPLNESFTVERRMTMASEVASGMLHLSELLVVHRDLAARNVLVDSLLVCKVADFGLSRHADSGSVDSAGGEYYKSQNGVFPVRWCAPEAMDTLKFSLKTDVWSFVRHWPTSSLVNSRTLMGYRQPHQCPRGSIASYHICADVRNSE